MPGISVISRVGLVAALAGLVLCAVLLAGFGANTAGASAEKSIQCSYRSVKPTETGKRLDAKGRLKCTGGGIQRQVLRVCLLQDFGSSFKPVKCVTHALNGPGLVTGTAARLCVKGPEVAFLSRINIRVRLTGGSVQKASSDSSKVKFERKCGS